MKLFKIICLMFCMGVLLPSQSFAWWNESWPYRIPISIDTTMTGANINSPVNELPVLIRLHNGNFTDFFYLKEDLGDLRFIAGDDKTPLKHHVERFDLINQMLFIWIKLPQISGNLNTEKIWMYYGNAEAVKAADAGGTFDVAQSAVFHFDAEQVLPQDVTAYGSHAIESTSVMNPNSLIAAGAQFDGKQHIQLPDALPLQVMPDKGYTFSAWVKPQGTQDDAYLYHRKSASGNEMILGIDQTALYAKIKLGNATIETPRTAPLTPDVWQFISMTYGNNKLSVYVNGVELAQIAADAAGMTGPIYIGASSSKTNGFTGEMDEMAFSNLVREGTYLKALASSQGIDNKLIRLNEAEQLGNAGGTSVFSSILHHANEDKFGLGIIISLVIMSIISLLVMFVKGWYLSRAQSDNKKFLKAYYALGMGDPAMLDKEEDDDDKAAEESPIAQAFFGKHDHFQSSPIYHMYHKGLKEVRVRMGDSVGASANTQLSTQGSEAIRASMDAFLVREMQKLNSKMVLLTIAISGGPFLGLLGTVVGVMITFAGIAEAGDVNINAIAPGMSAALLATVAGLAVAIPALFGYNYLGSRIKEISADMRVFVDEFITKISEHYG